MTKKVLKTPLARLEYMRAYYKTEKYRAWQRKYIRKKYKENKEYREKNKAKVNRYHLVQKLKKAKR